MDIERRALPKLVVLIGTKAQFIKTAPVLRELDRRAIDYRLVYTGQHRETFDVLEAVFGTRPPDDRLVQAAEADSASGLLGWTVRFLMASVRRLWRGDWAGASYGVVHGDTLSTLLSAIVLRLAGVRVAHIEAGLRSPRFLSPFPEEIVRRLMSRLARLHLAPDQLAVSNLAGAKGRVVNTRGNSLRDAVLMAMERLGEVPRNGGTGGYVVVSLHRSENLGRPAVFEFLMASIVETSRAIPVRFVLHPVTRRKLQRSGWDTRLRVEEGVELLERTDYVSFVRMLLNARFLMTDGGSNQEEAAMLGLPTLLMRDTTERPDGIEDGLVVLSGLDSTRIREFVGRHAGRTWSVRAVDQDSPSRHIVNALST